MGAQLRSADAAGGRRETVGAAGGVSEALRYSACFPLVSSGSRRNVQDILVW
jgi:hypothetical protein